MIQLLLIIRGYCCSFNDNQQSIYALESAKHHISTYYQGYKVTIMEHVEHFKALVGVEETYGGAYGNEPGLIKARGSGSKFVKFSNGPNTNSECSNLLN